ncbi:MAG TPA: hypothetical protein VG297_08090 [Bryobacteraceae bacterium]|nr:hypothetical protein [Bryobacteraceae bacterium]
MRTLSLATITTIVLMASALVAAPPTTGSQQSLPRTADGKPNLAGIWQASSTAEADIEDHAAGLNMLAGRSVVTGGGPIPYQPWAASQKAENFKIRAKADPLNQCYLPGTPRIMYMDYPFQIFQTPQAVGITFEWSSVYRLIYTNGTPHPDVDTWMGDSRGRWEGDTLVVDVAKYNDKTWFDMAGDFHSDALRVVERYKMTDADTIQYEATIEDPKVFTKSWTINVPLHRRDDRERLFEYTCQAEVEEANGAFTREAKTWYPGDGTMSSETAAAAPSPALPEPVKPVANLKRTGDGKPDLTGFWESQTPGANQGLEARGGGRGGRQLIIDPPDGKLPMNEWGMAERVSRKLTERGYDDPTAHCFPPGVPRAMYVPAALQIMQMPDYVVFLHERMAWRIVPLKVTKHLPDSMRLWQGDSLGHWEGDTLVIDTTNLNGQTWLNEGGEIVSYAEHVVERFTPSAPDTLTYEATVNDPVVYTKPWTISFPVQRKKAEMFETACHEEDRDLPRLKALKDAAAAKKK